MTEADLKPPRRTRVGIFLVVALLHLGAAIALLHAFAPSITTGIVDRAIATLAVTVVAPEQQPTPEPSPSSQADAGAAAPAGRNAVPKEVAAPKPRVTLVPQPAAPSVASTGSADSSGARDQGQGTGAGGQGNGTGSGGSGTGQGGGESVKMIAGDINSARDYPRESRDLRINDYVIIYLTVGTDGRARNCRIERPSKDEKANAITCRLAMERFRFRPATDSSGNPVESTYGWRQRWFY
jgi:protein TonB